MAWDEAKRRSGRVEKRIVLGRAWGAILSFANNDGDRWFSGSLDRVTAAAAEARDLTRDFLTVNGPILIDPEKIGGRHEAAAFFRHDLRAKLSLFETIMGTLERTSEQRADLSARLEETAEAGSREEIESELRRCERFIASTCEDVPDVIDELPAEAPDLDAGLVGRYEDYLESMRAVRERFVDA